MAYGIAVRASALVLAAVALAGCAGRSMREDAQGPASALPTVYRTQVATGTCVFRERREGFLATIGTALLSSAVSQGVNYVGRALSEAAKERDDRVVATRNVEVDRSSFGPCFVVVRGWFYRGFANDDQSRRTFNEAIATWAKAGGDSAIDENRLTLLWQRRLWLAAPPDFIFEAEAIPFSDPGKSDTAVLALAPVYARLDHPISSATLRRDRSREVAVFFAFHEATSAPDAPDTASGGIAVGRLVPGVGVTFPLAPDTSSQPNRGNDESRWFSVAVGDGRKPMTIVAVVTEHQDASAFLQFVADVFGGAKEQITGALQEAIVPANRAAAEQSARTRDETARSEYEDALTQAFAAAGACASAVTDPMATASDVRAKLRKLNQAARAARRSEISESMVPFSNDAKRVQDGCAALRAQLQAALG